MKQPKSIDCVRMKDEIQARLAERNRGLSDEAITRRLRRWPATADDPIAKLWRTASAGTKAPTVTHRRAKPPRQRKPAE